jgi:signal transduction histidine kinase
LIKNAIEAMKQGGTITVSVRCEDGKVLAEVADQGCGIPQEQLLKIGQPFYTTKDKGTGLGLMVSFKIIENHHGSISISSRSGEGTTFTIALPLACGQT